MRQLNYVVNPVNPHQQVPLPTPWDRLEAGGFHDDLVLRARAFLLQSDRLGFRGIAEATLEWVGQGFVQRFDPDRFRPQAGDPDFALKTRYLAALSELSDQFGDRVSAVAWETLAFLGTRPNPTQQTTILSVKEYLPFPFYFADAVLHALGKVYGFMLNMNAVVFAHTGFVPEHNCDCNHALMAPEGADGEGIIVKFKLPAERYREATAAFLSHLFGECLLIIGLKMPFEMGISPEAVESMNETMGTRATVAA